jgi:hypothetical protein
MGNNGSYKLPSCMRHGLAERTNATRQTRASGCYIRGQADAKATRQTCASVGKRYKLRLLTILINYYI